MNGSPDLVISGGMARFGGRRFVCAIGRSGVSAAKREGDGATPIGVFALEAGYFRADRLARPAAAVSCRPIGVFDGWSDDPDDPAYNAPVRRPHAWRCETLRRPDPLYDLVLVMDANRRPIRPGRGSALFVHVWRGPRRATEGCIAFRRTDLLWILSRWRPRSRVVVRPG